MARNVLINLDVDASAGQKSVDKLNDALQDTQSTAQGVTKQSGPLGKGLQMAGNLGTKAFNSIGAAIRATGIGLIVAGVALLFETLRNNQRFIDAFNDVLNTAGFIINGLVDSIGDVIDSVSESTGGFDALGRVLSGLITLALTPFRITWLAISTAITAAQLAWEQSIFGDGDPETIAALTLELENNRQELISIGEAAIQAGQDIIENFSEAVSEVGELGSGIIDAVGETIDAVVDGTALAAGQAATNAEKALARLELARARIEAQADIDAEAQRRRADNEQLLIEERIAATIRLGEILATQRQQELSNIDQQLAAQRALLAVNPESEEAQQALIELQNRRIEAVGRLSNAESEQQTSLRTLNTERLQRERDFQTELTALETSSAETRIENAAERERVRIENEREAAIEELQGRLELNELNETQARELTAAINDNFDAQEAERVREQNITISEAEQAGVESRLASRASFIDGLSAFAGEETALGRALLIAGQAQAIADIVQSTSASNAQNLVQATAVAPPPLNAPFIAAAVSQNVVNSVNSGIQIAGLVAQTAQSLGAFQSGGIVGGNSTAGDRVLVRVNSNEMILNNQQQRRLFDIADGQQSQSSQSQINVEEIVNSVVSQITQIPVVVLESDMTNVQRRVSTREQSLTS